ncbi:MAG TPA: trehalose-phosphatase, partial [Acidimicrobiia bacterium]|nr:trehalose-phosphatase [Acidimicrobiia bacterium]
MSLAGSVADLVGRGNVLIGVDFDGVLAPLVEHPDLAVPDPRAVSHLRRLAVRDNIEVAVISGRSLADLRERLG